MTAANFKIRKPYDPHERVVTEVVGKSLTKQSFRDECDINNLLKKYEKTGLLAHVARYAPRYADLVDAPTYQEAMNSVRLAQELFDDLPVQLRARFHNDPSLYLDFVADPANGPELRRMGILPAEPTAAAAAANAPEEAPQVDPEPSPEEVNPAG